MEKRILSESEVNHSKVLTSLLNGYAEKDSEVYDILNNTLSLVMAIDYIKNFNIDKDQYHQQRQLIEHFQKELTKKVVNIY